MPKDVPDEPLPVWHPTLPSKGNAIFTRPAPEAERAQHFRQAGLYVASIGFAALFASGILFVYAQDLNRDLSYTHAPGSYGQPADQAPNTFLPFLEDRRDQVEQAVVSLFVIGGAMAATGMILFAVGQAQLKSWHRQRPTEPLPPLSGY